ncbi:MAG: hypothetical protein A2W23_09000 [Planctomycetes bacterium RBG_16_43_13]|nr:MAG: hypothetical protein A2W23_09000 [Planctomycetes bacterium RBG_16_43_13]
MTKSVLFYRSKYKKLERDIKKFLNAQPTFMSLKTVSSTRAIGDAVQELLAENFKIIAGDIVTKYNAVFARRAMADLAFEDKDGFYYVIDVSTHNIETHFNMPNITSVERLTRFYEDDRNYFVLLAVAYSLKGRRVVVKNVHFVPIEFLSWDCLTIGALGWGQIQIANSNRIVIREQNRRKWMIEFCDTMLQFYPAEIDKTRKRISYFKKVKRFWQSKK